MSQYPIEDGQRDRVIADLRRHHAAGRLDDATLNQRVTTAMSTTDPAELNGLLDDLYSWQPDPRQQLAVPQPAAPPPAGHNYGSRSAWPRAFSNPGVITAIVVGLVVALVVSSASGVFWWPWWLIFIIIPLIRMLQNQSWNRAQPPPQQQQQPPSRPPIQDSYNPDHGGQDHGYPTGDQPDDGQPPPQWPQRP